MIVAAGTLYHLNVLEIIRHPLFMSAFVAAAAQVAKLLFASIRMQQMFWRELLEAGGMPRVHAALVSVRSPRCAAASAGRRGTTIPM